MGLVSGGQDLSFKDDGSANEPARQHKRERRGGPIEGDARGSPRDPGPAGAAACGPRLLRLRWRSLLHAARSKAQASK